MTATLSSRDSSRRRATIVLVAAAIVVVVTARLGVWQLDRAAQKEALQQTLDTRTQLPPVPAAM
ncbi:MAG: hypothetical protein K2X64_03690, partial [Rhodocyclaceae bacterium]|nr:hypothetical protein [Rhodocyclaceae bacterium]